MRRVSGLDYGLGRLVDAGEVAFTTPYDPSFQNLEGCDPNFHDEGCGLI
jgi:hypothetical protein